MTDTQNTAPERVWILRDLRGGVHVYDESGDAPEETRDDVGYIRADVAEAMVAAAVQTVLDDVGYTYEQLGEDARALIKNPSILARAAEIEKG